MLSKPALCDRLEQRVGVRVSRATMGRIVQKLKLTPEKKLCMQLSETLNECSNCECNIGTKLEQSMREDLVFVDETGSNLAMTRRYARSLKGSRAYNDAPYQRGNNLTKDWSDGTTGTGGGDDPSWGSRCTGL